MSSVIYVRREGYNLVEFILCLDVERSESVSKLKGHHTQRPKVYFLVVFCPLEKLWRCVQRGSTEGLSELALSVHGPAQIAQFNNALHK